MMRLLDAGQREPLKAAVHGAAFGLALVMGGYNLAAWLQRRERHLALNTIFYGCVAVIEAKKVRHHWRACP